VTPRALLGLAMLGVATWALVILAILYVVGLFS
jgi:hypothetical protein